MAANHSFGMYSHEAELHTICYTLLARVEKLENSNKNNSDNSNSDNSNSDNSNVDVQVVGNKEEKEEELKVLKDEIKALTSKIQHITTQHNIILQKLKLTYPNDIRLQQMNQLPS